ncbi:MAG: 1,4-dihydroxy-2-naphthoate polyprenyltransferase [Geodermatophilaceae bacterium]|nr:1,4-dihydroxy-2-naphthoate polyprenyltransferase [Geodermatophilaceae bacterium]MDQ3465586.1 1,4-dihydroxy-2-naphthoate polyprenyltransferase [Actinomycetota bacterium]
MTTAAQWMEGARPRTLPAAVTPVAVGTGLAFGDDLTRWAPATLALVVALALQVGVNYANDYSDGVRGTDAQRVGPFRLVGSGAASPSSVRSAAFAAFGVAAVTGLVLAALTSWWLVAVGAACLAAAWTYTGGNKPYGYRALGELSVFVFFGLVAVVGTYFVHSGHITLLAALVAIPVGMLACALLVVNNLRDIPTDATAGKQTLAVVLGDRRTRLLSIVLLLAPFVIAGLLTTLRPWAWLPVVAIPLAIAPVRHIRAGAAGSALIATLRDTGRLQLVFGLLLAVGLAAG